VNVAPGSMVREIELEAPAGWEFRELPKAWSLKTALGEGSMHYWTEGGVAKGEMQLRIDGGVLDRGSYLAYRDLVNAAVAAERRPVILRRTKPAPTPANPAPPASH
jgi:hypothetical protein